MPERLQHPNNFAKECPDYPNTIENVFDTERAILKMGDQSESLLKVSSQFLASLGWLSTNQSHKEKCRAQQLGIADRLNGYLLSYIGIRAGVLSSAGRGSFYGHCYRLRCGGFCPGSATARHVRYPQVVRVRAGRPPI